MLHENVLHDYVNMLRIRDGAPFEGEKKEMRITALHNIIRTMRISRNGFICREDFSHLDFGSIRLDAIKWSDNGKAPTVFSHSVICKSNFVSGHASDIIAATWTPDYKYIITVGNDRLIVWDSQTCLEMYSYDITDCTQFQYTGQLILKCEMDKGGYYCLLWKPYTRLGNRTVPNLDFSFIDLSTGKECAFSLFTFFTFRRLSKLFNNPLKIVLSTWRYIIYRRKELFPRLKELHESETAQKIHLDDGFFPFIPFFFS